MERTAVYAVIDSEREHQDAKWGALAEHPHEVGGWLTLMAVHLRHAQEAWAGSRGDAGALEELRKVIAIGVACGEQHGLPARAGWDTPQCERRCQNCKDEKTETNVEPCSLCGHRAAFDLWSPAVKPGGQA